MEQDSDLGGTGSTNSNLWGLALHIRDRAVLWNVAWCTV